MKYICKPGETFKAFVQSDESKATPGRVASRVSRLYLFTADLFATSSYGYIVYPRENVPIEISSVCNRAGGDEDWYVVCFKHYDSVETLPPAWLEKIDADNDSDVYEFDSGFESTPAFTVYVGTH